MRYINCGVLDGRGQRIPTKKQLKAELASDRVAGVYFDTTSMFDGEAGFAADAIPDDVVLSVVGPDPFTKRSWYASVRNERGSLRVS